MTVNLLSQAKQFVVCDLSSIEVVVLGWLAQCPSILSVFEEGRDPYIDFATRFFNRPYDQITKEERQVCKPPVLGCGYGLGGGDEELDRNGDEIRTGLWGYAQNMGVDMPREQAYKAVQIYRDTYREIPRAWRKWENAAIRAVQTGEKQTVGGNLTFGCAKSGKPEGPEKLLWVALPSGRRLHYIRPQVKDEQVPWDSNEWGGGPPRFKLSYEGQIIGQHWGRVPTWGGKITENLVQAIARDVLAHGMLRAAEAGFTIVGTAHDEIICLEDVGSTLNAARLRECMISRPTWAIDLPLNAQGFEAERYRKD